MDALSFVAGVIAGVGGTFCITTAASFLESRLPALNAASGDPVIEELDRIVGEQRSRHEYADRLKAMLREEFGETPPEYIRRLIDDIDELLAIHRMRESR